ncbi:MAG: hypothetical protein JW902_14315 [Syntrophaceae bacterium]|nr:hypothetical protein [Syntrophaceae bacterium]
MELAKVWKEPLTISQNDISACCEVRRKMANGEQWQGKADRDLLNAVGVDSLTSGLDETMRKGAVLKDGSKSFVSHAELGGREVVIKGYRHLGWFHSLRHTFKGSRAHTAWLTANRLLCLGVSTPKPLAYIDVYKDYLLWCSYFIYDYASGPELYGVLKDPTEPESRKQLLIRKVLNAIKRLSEHGISHGDLKHSNMICEGDQIVFIDLDAMRPIIGPAIIRRWRYEKDRSRFLRDIVGQ